MKKFIFAIRDRASASFLDPFMVNHKGLAERMFKDAINDPKTPLNKHPEDYDLYEFGTFDDGTGVYEVRIPEQVSLGKSVYSPASMQDLSAAGQKEMFERVNGRLA